MGSCREEVLLKEAERTGRKAAIFLDNAVGRKWEVIGNANDQNSQVSK
jgi:hypothetical protein